MTIEIHQKITYSSYANSNPQGDDDIFGQSEKLNPH